MPTDYTNRDSVPIWGGVVVVKEGLPEDLKSKPKKWVGETGAWKKDTKWWPNFKTAETKKFLELLERKQFRSNKEQMLKGSVSV